MRSVEPGLPSWQRLAACDESHTALRTAHIHHLFVAKPRNIPDIPSVRRLDLPEHLSFWSAEHFQRRLLVLVFVILGPEHRNEGRLRDFHRPHHLHLLLPLLLLLE